MRTVSDKIKKLIALIMAVTMALAFFPARAEAAEKVEILSSKTAMLYCMESDTVLFTHNNTERVHPGVLIKLMVAIVALDEAENKGLNLDSSFTASREAIRNTKGKHISMQTGEQFRLYDLISVMLHTDADDAALVIAEEIADNSANFVELMNAKAADLGMKNTKYFSVTGTNDEKSYTTAEDQTILASFAIKLYTISEIAKQIRVVIPATNKSDTRYYGTTNYLISTRVNADYYFSHATGLICGSKAESGYCAILTSRKDGLNYIAVITGAENSRILVSEEREELDENGNPVIIPAEYKTIYHGLNEGRALLEWGESRFSYIKAVDTATPITDIPVKLGSGTDRVALLPEFDVEIFVPDDVDKEKEISFTYVLDRSSLTAPVKAGQRVGTLYVMYKGESIGEVPLITKTNIDRDGYLMLLERVRELASTPFFTMLIILTAFAAVFYVISTAVTRQQKLEKRRREAERGRHYLSSGDKK